MSRASNTDKWSRSNSQSPPCGSVVGDHSPPGNQQIDERSAVAALGGNAELLRELGTMFCEDAPIVLQELQQAASEGDSLAVRRAAHSIKGLAATFFARNTCEIALRLESEAAEGNLTALQAGGIERLRNSIEDLSDELRRRGFTT